jgi:hypothetical protein
MLARPEIGTMSHVRLWLQEQPRDREYDWMSPETNCACAIYAAENGLEGDWHRYPDLCALDSLASLTIDDQHHGTFGVLCDDVMAYVVNENTG